MSPTRTASASAADLVATADAELQEAADLVTVLEDRVRDGDDAVQPAELEKARGLFRFAQLRRDAATKKAEAALEAEARAKYEQLLADNLEAATADIAAQTDGLLAEARAKFVEALELLRTKNLAVYRIAKYAADDDNYRDDRLGSGQVPIAGQAVSGAVWFSWDDVTYSPASAASLARQMLDPVRGQIPAGGGYFRIETA